MTDRLRASVAFDLVHPPTGTRVAGVVVAMAEGVGLQLVPVGQPPRPPVLAGHTLPDALIFVATIDGLLRRTGWRPAVPETVS